MSKVRVVYAVEYIEIEFGERPEGFKLYLDLETCRTDTKADSDTGAYGGSGYLGPRRPLSYVEVPYSTLPAVIRRELTRNGVCATPNNWWPDFTGLVHFF